MMFREKNRTSPKSSSPHVRFCQESNAHFGTVYHLGVQEDDGYTSVCCVDASSTAAHKNSLTAHWQLGPVADGHLLENLTDARLWVFPLKNSRARFITRVTRALLSHHCCYPRYCLHGLYPSTDATKLNKQAINFSNGVLVPTHGSYPCVVR